MKPPGVGIGLANGLPTLYVTRSDRTSGAIWEAVEAAIEAGWSVDKFRREAASAWEDKQRQQMRDDQREWRQP